MNPTNPIPFDTPLAVTLEAQQWNTVLGLLAKGQYDVVQPVIDQIKAQVMTGANQVAVAAAAAITANASAGQPQLTNGVDHGDHSKTEAGAAEQGLRIAGEGDREGR
jgi:hypothetical protein